MTEQQHFVLEYLRNQYAERNQFYNLLGISIDWAYNGHSKQSMFVEQKHSNLHANMHGGVLVSMGDSCMGVACASLGKQVVTLDIHVNFLANMTPPARVYCEANVIHNGHKSIVMGAKVFDEDGRTLGVLRSTYYVVGVFEEIAARLPDTVLVRPR